MPLNTRKPTGQVPYPVILLEGEEKSGKTWAALSLSASPMIGATYLLDLGEGSADEYGAIPGVDYEVLVHDGTYAQILEQIEAVRDVAQQASAAGERPVVLIVDTMTALWDGLKDWVSERAKSKPSNQKKLQQDPAAELDVSRNLWNDAASRHTRVMNILLRFPGIVVMTARGKEVSATDPTTGQPYRDARKEYRVEGQKGLAYAATAWVRMSRTQQPIVVGARSVHTGIVPGKDEPKPITNEPKNLLEWLIFDALCVDPSAAHVRDMQNVTGGALTSDEVADEKTQRKAERSFAGVFTDQEWYQAALTRAAEAPDTAALLALHDEAKEKDAARQLEHGHGVELRRVMAERAEALKAPAAESAA